MTYDSVFFNLRSMNFHIQNLDKFNQIYPTQAFLSCDEAIKLCPLESADSENTNTAVVRTRYMKWLVPYNTNDSVLDCTDIQSM